MSNKPLQDSLLEAGIIPKNAVWQMEQWKAVPKGSTSKVGEFSIDRVNALREDIGLRQLPELRETILDVGKLLKEARPVVLVCRPLTVTGVPAGVDILGRYIVEIPKDSQECYNQLAAVMRNMTILHDKALKEGERNRLIVQVQVLWKTVEQVNQKFEVPTHWFLTTEVPSQVKKDA